MLPSFRNQRMKHLTKGSGWIFLSLKIMIAAATMIIIVRNINFNYIYSALIHPQNPRFFLLALFLLIPNIVLQWYRWHYLLKMSGLSITFWESFSSLLGGLAVGFVTPGRIGEMGRFLFIQKGDPLQAVGLVFIDKLFSFVIILIFGILGLFHFMSVITSRSTFLLWPLFVIVFLVAVIALLIVLHPQWIRHSLYHISLILPYRDKIQRLITSLDHFDGVKAARFLIMTICQYFI